MPEPERYWLRQTRLYIRLAESECASALNQVMRLSEQSKCILATCARFRVGFNDTKPILLGLHFIQSISATVARG